MVTGDGSLGHHRSRDRPLMAEAVAYACHSCGKTRPTDSVTQSTSARLVVVQAASIGPVLRSGCTCVYARAKVDFQEPPVRSHWAIPRLSAEFLQVADEVLRVSVARSNPGSVASGRLRPQPR